MPEDVSISYPALYTFRVIARTSDTVAQRVRRIVAAVVGVVPEDAVVTKPSSGGTYTAVHVSCLLISEDQRAEIYGAFKADPDIILSL